jgi:glycosyltransferase involved in cell wall biosynthesis
MKVVHIFKDFYPPTTGGIEQHMSLLCGRLSRKVEVTVLVPSRSRRRTEEGIKGVRVIRVPEFGRFASVPLCPTTPFELRRLNPDIVHLHFPNPMGDLAYLLGGNRAPLVLTYHSDIIKQKIFLPLYNPVLQWLLGKAHRILVSSEEYIESSNLLSGFRRKCTLVPFGIELENSVLRDGEEAEAASFRRNTGDWIVLFVGTHRYYKGLEILLQAMAQVPGCLVAAGRGTDGDALRNLASRFGIAHKVVLCGEVSDARLRILMNSADVFVLPSIDRCEAFGIAQLEAMACAKPVIASDLPTGVRFVTQHGVTGLLVKPGDPAALAEALNRMFRDSSMRETMGRAARQRVEQEFTADRMADRTLGVYREVLGQ